MGNIYSFTRCLTLLLLMLISGVSCSEKEPAPIQNNKNVGVQVYSVRNELAQNFDSTLAKLSDIGFYYIEAYGLSTDGLLYGMPPEDYKKAVEKHDMKLVSTHSDYFTSDEAPVMIDAAKKAGLEYVIIPWTPEELRGDYVSVAQNLNDIGAQFKKAGIGFAYHNHDFEFYPTESDEIPLDILLEETAPENVDFQLDLYWVVKAGANPMEILNKYQGRFSAFHIKDSDENLNQTTVGTGLIDFKTVLTEKEISGYKFYFVEDERTDNPFSNLKSAFDYLQTLDF